MLFIDYIAYKHSSTQSNTVINQYLINVMIEILLEGQIILLTILVVWLIRYIIEKESNQ